MARRNLWIVILGVSIVALIWSVLSGEKITFKDFMGTIPPLVAMFAAKEEEKKRKTVSPIGQIKVPPFQLPPSFTSGVYGGLIGGLLTGLIMGAAYNPARVGWEKVLEIFIFASVSGVGFGALSQLAIERFRYLANERLYPGLIFNEVFGGIFGGMIAGSILGGLGGWFFGLDRTPIPNITLFSVGLVLGAILVPLGTLFYDYKGSWGESMRALLVSATITTLVAIVGVAVSRSMVLVRSILEVLSSPNIVRVIGGGVILGLLIGVVVGSQVGITLRLYRQWATASNRNTLNQSA